MKLSYEIVDLYREIGKEFRRLGAEKVILLKSRTNPDKEEEIFLEIAVEGFVKKEMLLEKGKKLWPFVSMEIVIVDEQADRELVQEVMEDGILI